MPCPEAAALERYRLEHDLAWQDLADQMRAAKCPLTAGTLHRLLDAPDDYKPYARTLFKIRRFLERRAAATAALVESR